MTKRELWDAVGQMNCVVSGRPFPTIHHCHGGSVMQLGITRGMGTKPSDFLVIPLAAEYHTGENGVDRIGVKTWERRYGSQVEYLKEVGEFLGVDLFELAGFDIDWSKNES